ncbi:potassium transporter Kef [Rhodococcus rhodnii]|uniref:Potassium transporter Kef n=1 Tax=Rhodococcus rhodnii TaxID=38312 RepID=A0A6P2CJV6_9NOCA|nr:potassium channel family protein [Rhodococcus rhodnii]TXG92140.1 potassium transporter Kef [Rhodococcus rhodnii]
MGSRFVRFRPRRQLTERPFFALVGVVHIPEDRPRPSIVIGRRIGYAIAILLVATTVVYLDRDGYGDDELSLVDALYYSASSLATTGYGDIAPATPAARLVEVVVMTPLRLAFLLLLVGTTLAALTERSRRDHEATEWHEAVSGHTVVLGFGTKGTAAVSAIASSGFPGEIVVVDRDEDALARARLRGLVTVDGDVTDLRSLRVAAADRAGRIVVSVGDDRTAVLATLTARSLTAGAEIVAAAREAPTRAMLRRAGADAVVTSAETTGRLLGVATRSPSVVTVVDDMLTPETGYRLAERSVRSSETGRQLRGLEDIVVSLVRDGALRAPSPDADDTARAGDRILYLENRA